MTSPAAQGRKGRFISFEGGEGTGKSTQARRLADRLNERGIGCVSTREPGGTQGAEIVRRAVLSGRVKNLGPFAEALLMNAARDDHLCEVIRPALAAGKWVITDRFADSTRAYQGVLGGLDENIVAALEQAVIAGTWPDLTIILDIDPHIGLKRARDLTRTQGEGEGDRFEDVELSYHEQLREAFLKIAAAEPERCMVIDASGSEADIAEMVWAAVEEKFLSEALATEEAR